jgi:phage terminase small subunit
MHARPDVGTRVFYEEFVDMGKGRKPLPTAIRLARGTRTARVNGSEPVYGPAVGDPPADLGRFGMEKWNELAPILLKAGVLTVADRTALETLCRCWEAWRVDPLDYKAMIGVMRMLTAMGLTPADRSKVRVDSKPADALGDFLNRMTS